MKNVKSHARSGVVRRPAREGAYSQARKAKKKARIHSRAACVDRASSKGGADARARYREQGRAGARRGGGSQERSERR